MYGSIAVTVICVAWYGKNLWELGLAVAGYSVTLWLAHIYSEVVPRGSHRVTWQELREMASHSRQHLLSAVPALVTIAIGAILRMDPMLVNSLAVVATLVNLVLWEIAALRPSLPSRSQLFLTVAIDVVVLALIIGLRVLTK